MTMACRIFDSSNRSSFAKFTGESVAMASPQGIPVSQTRWGCFVLNAGTFRRSALAFV